MKTKSQPVNSFRNTNHRLVATAIALLWLTHALAAPTESAAQSGSKSASGKNVALGKKYTFSPKPAYRFCTDPGDTTQLTDGRLTEGRFWTQKGCVGWQTKEIVSITIDLGRVAPIRGASFRTAGGSAGVTWPAAIEIAVSDDGKNYRIVDDLVERALKEGNPWPSGYGVLRLVTDKLHTRGRFVRMLIVPTAGRYVFCDEIEIFRGPDEWLNDEPGGRPLGDLKKRTVAVKMRSAIRSRYAADVAAVRKAVETAKLPHQSAQKDLLKRIAAADKTLRESSLPGGESFRAILPYSDAHAELFAVQAALWKAQGRALLWATVVNPWDPSELFTTPPASGGKIEIHAMRGEYRAAALNLANSSNRPMTVRLSLEGLPGGPTPGCLSVAQVPWTDTGEGKPVMAALPRVEPADGCWSITVLPGLMRQVWFTLHSKDVPAGRHQGQIVIESDFDGTKTIRTPLALTIYPVDFPKKTTIELGGWSYTNGRGSYAITAKNKKAFLRHLQERFVNAPWANSGVFMTFKFNDDGRIVLDTRQMDDWLAQWPNARQYYVYMAFGGYASSVRNNFAGAKLGTAEFDRRVGAWITAWVEHLKSKGVEPHQLSILFYDEPTYASDAASIIKWIEAVRAAQPDVKAWLDPVYKNPAKGSAELLAACDILCPNRPMWLTHKKAFQPFYREQQRQGRELQLYSCSGPARLLDPYAYYRLQAWHCWKIGATGSFYWAYGDNGYASSWNPYLSTHGPFTPLYIDAEVLNAADVDNLIWHNQKNRATADAVRVKILKAIVDLQ